MTAAVHIVTGGRWTSGAVTGGDARAARRIDLAWPVNIGRAAGLHIVLPGAGDETSGVAARLVATGADVKLQVWNRAGAVVLSGADLVHVCLCEPEPEAARGRRDVLVYDGDIVWIPPEALEAGDLPLEGGWWLRLELPAHALVEPSSPVVDDAAFIPLRTRTVVKRALAEAPAGLSLTVDQKRLLTAIYAEAIVRGPDRAWQASSPEQVAAMVWPHGDPPAMKALGQRIFDLRDKILRQTGIAMPDAPGRPVYQRLALWCQENLRSSWFDRDMAAQMLDRREGR